MSRAVINLDRVKGHPYSFICEGADLEQGALIELAEINADGETYKAVAPTGDDGVSLGFHASVPLQYDERLTELDFYLAKGKVGRVYVWDKGDMVTIDETMFESVVAVGDYLVPKIGSFKFDKYNTETPNGTRIAKVMEKTTFFGQPCAVIQFV